jgi:hypothetical protein
MDETVIGTRVGDRPLNRGRLAAAMHDLLLSIRERRERWLDLGRSLGQAIAQALAGEVPMPAWPARGCRVNPKPRACAVVSYLAAREG